MNNFYSYILICSLSFFSLCDSRVHKLEIKQDQRKNIPLSTFGFYKEGILDVKLINLRGDPELETSGEYGFAVIRSINDEMSSDLDVQLERCPLSPIIFGAYVVLDLKQKLMKVNCSQDMEHLHIYKSRSDVPSDAGLLLNRKKRSLPQNNPEEQEDQSAMSAEHSSCADFQIPIDYDEKEKSYNASFVIYIATTAEEGLYNLYFHSCPNYGSSPVSLDFTVEIEESNHASYLSAGAMPLPSLNSIMAILYFLSGCLWVFILFISKHPVYKIHYLMAIMVYLKSLSLLVHSINYHFIQVKGEGAATWTILDQVSGWSTNLVLFTTLVLIGSGWTFMKNTLSCTDKLMLMIVFSSQALLNVARTIIEAYEEEVIQQSRWPCFEFLVLDFFRCTAVFISILRSIRYCRELALTDFKAGTTLLKPFKVLLFMFISYLYATRIFVLLIQTTVSFQYEWLGRMVFEGSTFVFFVMIAYFFRPASANPYVQDSLDENDDVKVVLK